MQSGGLLQSAGRQRSAGCRAATPLQLLLFAVFGVPAALLGSEPAAPPRDEPAALRFATDIVPVLTKLGCNSGGCHGKATGQNGFKLSLLGFEPTVDFRAVVLEGRGRRVFPAAPSRSLLLRKATNQTPHGGGRRTAVGSEEYNILAQWIADGASPPAAGDPGVARIAVTPRKKTFDRPSRQPLRVTATLSDGELRDVTRLAVFESNEPAIGSVGPTGVVETHGPTGLFAVMVRYGGQIATFQGATPVPATLAERSRVDAELARLERELTSPLDPLLIRQWRRLGIAPSAPADDAAFLRRASLDICGTLPTPEQVAAYVEDSRADKQSRLINWLLERPEYSRYFALKWADILQNRGAGYSTRWQREGTSLFAGWIRDSLAANKPYDQFVAEILTASGSQRENPPAVWHRQVRTPSGYVESVAQAFLGVRIQCAQCHHHPFDRWSQADYYGLAAVFARVGRKGGFADAEVPTDELIYLKDEGKVTHPRTGATLSPKALGGPEFRLSRYDDPRQSLAAWMRSPDNPYFARTLVNRMWAHFLGRGLIDPIDDARSSNPPTNPELLDALSEDFVAHGYDIKRLIRLICNCHAYRLESAPNGANRHDSQSFARFYPRRLAAEVLLDAVSQALDSPTPFTGGPGALPEGTRAIELPDENVPVSFLDVFGRPPRTSACECERVGAPSLAQALTLINSEEIQRKLTDPRGFAAQLAASPAPPSESVSKIFLQVLGRSATKAELRTAVTFLESAGDVPSAYRSLLWSLLATNEFLFNH